MIVKMRITVIRGDEVLAMGTFPLEFGPGRSAVWDMSVVEAKFLRRLETYRPQLDDLIVVQLGRQQREWYSWEMN